MAAAKTAPPKSADKTRWRVLVFPAGTENAIEIWRALSPCKEVKLFAASGPVSNHSHCLYSRVFGVDDVKSGGGWLAQINKIVRDNSIDYIFPANDDVIDALNRERDKVACPLVLPPAAAVEVCRSKSQTKRALRGLVPVAREPGKDGAARAPVALKPDDGYGGKGFVVSQGAARRAPAGMIREEYLPGREFTVDCFTDRRGRALFCGGRERVRVRMGTSMRARLAPQKTQKMFNRWAGLISQRLNMRGAWFFQAKEDAQGQMRLTEVDVRIAGTMNLNRARGVNFPLLCLYDLAGEDVEILLLDDKKIEVDRALRNRYLHRIKYETAYVDWDDTVVVNGKINLQMARFLFQCVNEGVRVVLLTQSLSKNLKAEIARRRLSGVFDEVIHIAESEDKAAFIKPGKAIFIDDSFCHRRRVYERRKIPCFAPDMVEVLISDKI